MNLSIMPLADDKASIVSKPGILYLYKAVVMSYQTFPLRNFLINVLIMLNSSIPNVDALLRNFMNFMSSGRH